MDKKNEILFNKEIIFNHQELNENLKIAKFFRSQHNEIEKLKVM